MTTLETIAICLATIQTAATVVAAVIAWRSYFDSRPRPVMRWSHLYVPFLIIAELFSIGIIVFLVFTFGWITILVGLIVGLPVASFCLYSFFLVEEYRRRKRTIRGPLK